MTGVNKLANNYNRPMVITLLIIALLAIILLVGRIKSSVQFKAEVKDLFAQSKAISDQTFKQEQLLIT